MAFEWFRSWHGAPTDNKWLVIAHRSHAEGVTPGMVSALAWALLDYASQHTDRGSVEGFDVETYVVFTGWHEDQIEAILKAMRGKGIITEDNRLAAWEKRQPKREDPTAAERQARHRDAQRNASVTRDNNVTDEVTQSNAVSRGVTQKNARLDKTRSDETRLDDRQEEKRPLPEQNFAAAVAAWEAGGGMLSKTIADDIGEAVDHWAAKGYGHYVADAIEEATRQGKLTWSYVMGILRGCEREQRAPSNKARRNGTDPSPFPSPVVDGKIKMIGEDGTIEEVEAMTNG